VRRCCDELITLSEESYRLWCVVLCNLEISRMRRPRPTLSRSVTGGGNEGCIPVLTPALLGMIRCKSSYPISWCVSSLSSFLSGKKEVRLWISPCCMFVCVFVFVCVGEGVFPPYLIFSDGFSRNLVWNLRRYISLVMLAKWCAVIAVANVHAFVKGFSFVQC